MGNLIFNSTDITFKPTDLPSQLWKTVVVGGSPEFSSTVDFTASWAGISNILSTTLPSEMPRMVLAWFGTEPG
jgi:hypothetical protein